MTTTALKPDDIAAALAISTREARRLCAEGKIRGAFKVGAVWRVWPDDFDAYVRDLRGITGKVLPMKERTA